MQTSRPPRKKSTRRGAKKKAPSLEGKGYFRVPNHESSTHELIMFGFHRVPKSETDVKAHERMRAAVPDDNITNDSLFKRVSNSVQSKIISEMKYMHCEVAFKKTMFNHTTDAPDTAVAFGVFNTDRDGNRGSVWVKERTFISPFYDWLFLKVPKKVAYAYAKFHQDQVGKPFDSGGLRGVYTIPGECDGHSWFCVSLHMFGANKVGLIKGYEKDCSKATVDEFYNIMSRNKYRTTMEMIPLDQYRYSKCRVDDLLPELSPSAKGRRGVSAPSMSHHSDGSVKRYTKTGARIERGYREFENVIPGVVVPRAPSKGARRKKESTHRRGRTSGKTKTTIVDYCILPES